MTDQNTDAKPEDEKETDKAADNTDAKTGEGEPDADDKAKDKKAEKADAPAFDADAFKAMITAHAVEINKAVALVEEKTVAKVEPSDDLAKAEGILTETKVELAKMQDDLAKRNDELQKLSDENTALKAEKSAWLAAPAPIKGALKAVTVSKTDDANGVDAKEAAFIAEVTKAAEAKDVTALIKITQSLGGVKIN